jgi:hypothetical protein
MENKWQLILHEDCEDPYYEITNGPISLCAPCGIVGETEEQEDEIFTRVLDALNTSGVDFHSENPLELKQHIEIQALQAKCDRYENLIQNILDYISECKGSTISMTGRVTAIENTLSKALSAGEGKKEVENGE